MRIITSLIIAIAMLLSTTGCAEKTPHVIAHRGYWDTDGSAQNSIRSIVKADSIDCFGSEFDVWMTADGQLVVYHDDAVNGFVIENSNADDVLSQKLENGENVPTLDRYLEAGKNLGVRLIFELKPHTDRAQESQAITKLLDMVQSKGLADRIDYITFSKEGMLELIERAPAGTPVYYLNGEMTPEELKEAGAAGMDYELDVLKAHPEWIDRCHELGLKVNAWTVNEADDLQWCIYHKLDFITTNYPELLQSLKHQQGLSK